MALIGRHRWPGNIRQLRAMVLRSVILQPGKSMLEALFDDAPAAWDEPEPEGLSLDDSVARLSLKQPRVSGTRKAVEPVASEATPASTSGVTSAE